jgi:hypothetical protein
VAYVLNAVIGRIDALTSVGTVVIVPLAHGLGLVPLTDDFWQALGHRSQPLRREIEGVEAPDDEFESPGEREQHIATARADFAAIATLCARASEITPIAYVEAESFGGSGIQAAAVWIAGTIVLDPFVDDEAINEALRTIGVARGLQDEFDALDLGRHRFTDDWVPAT